MRVHNVNIRCNLACLLKLRIINCTEGAGFGDFVCVGSRRRLILHDPGIESDLRHENVIAHHGKDRAAQYTAPEV